MSTLNRKFLGLHIKHHRVVKGVPVSVLAAKIGKSSSYYYRLEKGLVHDCAASIKILFAFYGLKYTNERFK